MTKKYIHTMLGRKAELIDKEEDVYCFVDDDANEHNFYGNELCSLGFIEAPTEEVVGDSIIHWTKEFTFDNKDKKLGYITVGDTKYVPVEQELIPLDAEQLVQDIYNEMFGDYDHKTREINEEIIKKHLSKYGVHKQGESFEEKFGKLHGTLKRCNCTPLTATEAQVIQREREHELIQAYEKGRKDVSDKKFTKQYVREKMSEFPCVTSYIINQTYKFLEKEGLLSD